MILIWLRLFKEFKMNDKAYNYQLCEERHEYISQHFKDIDARIWTIILLLVANLGGVITVIFKVFGV